MEWYYYLVLICIVSKLLHHVFLFIILEGIVPPMQSLLCSFLTTTLPESVSIQDASLEVLCLLRILNALNRHWNILYCSLQYRSILPHSDFLNSKIAAKASRQLQDPLVIMTGNLPSWLHQIASVW